MNTLNQNELAAVTGGFGDEVLNWPTNLWALEQLLAQLGDQYDQALRHMMQEMAD